MSIDILQRPLCLSLAAHTVNNNNLAQNRHLLSFGPNALHSERNTNTSVTATHHDTVSLAHGRFQLVEGGNRLDVQENHRVLLMLVGLALGQFHYIVTVLQKVHQLGFDLLVKRQLGEVGAFTIEVFVTVYHGSDLLIGWDAAFHTYPSFLYG